MQSLSLQLCRIAVPLLIAAAASQMQAQTQYPPSVPSPELEPDAWELVQDTMYVLRYFPGSRDTLPRHMACASHTYAIRYDSLCQAEYLLSEWKKNGIPLRMPDWKYRKLVNLRSDYSATGSRTDTFTCRTGDTLSFFRWFTWKSLVPGSYGTEYAVPDTLDFVMELVCGDDAGRAALIDSMGVLPRTSPGHPFMYGAYPLMALVTYVVPPELDGVTAFMRMRLYHRGRGESSFTRADNSTEHASGLLRAPWNRKHLLYYMAYGFRREVQERASGRSAADRLQIISETQDSHAVKIGLRGAPPGLLTSILVTDINGEIIFYPMLGAPDIEGRAEIPYRFPQSGSYLVALIHQDQLQDVVRWDVAE